MAEPEEDMSKFLSANELRILGLVLAEYLSDLKRDGLDIESASAGEFTKEKVVMHLRNIGQNQLALLLSKKRGEYYIFVCMVMNCIHKHS